MYKVKIVGGEKKNVIQREHTIPAPNKDDARTWGQKQAKALGIQEPHVITVEPV